jgi:hypothetical protein
MRSPSIHPEREEPTGPTDGAEGTRRPRSPWLAGTAAVVLVALMAVASRGTTVWAPLREGRADRLELLLAVGLIAAIGLAAAFAVALVVERRRGAQPADTPADMPPVAPAKPLVPPTLLRILPIAVVAITAAALLEIGRMDGARVTGRDAAASDGGLPGMRAAGRGSSDPRRDTWVTQEDAGDPAGEGGQAPARDPLPLRLLTFVGVVAVVIAGTLAWSRHASRGTHRALLAGAGQAPPDAQHAAVRGTIADTIDAMLADPDPKTAIIGAYARLLEGLAACGIERRPYEAPVEHMRRVLTGLRVRAEPLRQLIGLFEIARFSMHLLTDAHRDQALAALRSIAADLAGAPARQPEQAGVRAPGAVR